MKRWLLISLVAFSAVDSLGAFSLNKGVVSLGRQHQEIESLLEKLSPKIENGTIIMPTNEEQKSVTTKILSISKRSKRARQKVIDSLLEVFARQSIASDVRIYIAYLLSEIKAVEALDILVQHLDTTGSFSSLSLNANPMVAAVVRYGDVAVPHLEKGLFNGTSKVREQACVALGLIGGEQSEKAIRRALNEQGDTNVRDCAAGALRQIESIRRQIEGRRMRRARR